MIGSSSQASVKKTDEFINRVEGFIAAKLKMNYKNR